MRGRERNDVTGCPPVARIEFWTGDECRQCRHPHYVMIWSNESRYEKKQILTPWNPVLSNLPTLSTMQCEKNVSEVENDRGTDGCYLFSVNGISFGGRVERTAPTMRSVGGHMILFRVEVPMRVCKLGDGIRARDLPKPRLIRRDCEIDRVMSAAEGSSSIVPRIWVLFHWFVLLARISVQHTNSEVRSISFSSRVETQAVVRYMAEYASKREARCDTLKWLASLYSTEVGDEIVVVPVYFPVHYEFRGIKFRHLNRQEFYCINLQSCSDRFRATIELPTSR